MRQLLLLLVVSCGPAYAPVSAVLDRRPFLGGGVFEPTMSLVATRKLNPRCSANCEMGATFADGTSGAWYPFDRVSPDGGLRLGQPRDVMVGSVVTAYLTHGDVVCEDSRDVTPGGFEVTLVRFADGGMIDCDFSYR